MIKIKEKIKDWEKEFEENEDVAWIKQLTPAGSYKRMIDFIRQLLAQRDKMWQERIKTIRALDELSS